MRQALKPGGLFCARCYSLLEVSPTLDPLIRRLYGTTLDGYWPAGRASVDAGYSDIPLPFARTDTPDFAIEAHWNLAELLGYLRTVSGQTMATPTWPRPHRAAGAGTGDRLGPPQQRRPIRWPLHLLAGFPNR